MEMKSISPKKKQKSALLKRHTAPYKGLQDARVRRNRVQFPSVEQRGHRRLSQERESTVDPSTALSTETYQEKSPIPVLLRQHPDPDRVEEASRGAAEQRPSRPPFPPLLPLPPCSRPRSRLLFGLRGCPRAPASLACWRGVSGLGRPTRSKNSRFSSCRLCRLLSSSCILLFPTSSSFSASSFFFISRARCTRKESGAIATAIRS